MSYKANESTGAGGNNGDYYFNGATEANASTNAEYVTIDASGNKSRIIPESSNVGSSGGIGSSDPNTAGGSGIDGAAFVGWPVIYNRRDDGKIQYRLGLGSLPPSGTIRFSDLAQLGTQSDGSVILSSYYRGSNFIPTAGFYSDKIPYTTNTGQKNLGAYRIQIGVFVMSGFRNYLSYPSGGSSTFTLPSGVRYLNVELNGAGGGGGGFDDNLHGVGPAGNGGTGKVVEGMLDLETTVGNTVTVHRGLGGLGGFKSNGGGGASQQVSSYPNYDGGPGGNAGTAGFSGGGGSGGGGSFFMYGTDIKAVAGGGGGGGGQARSSDNIYKNGGQYYPGTLAKTQPSFSGTSGLSYTTLGYYETYIQFTDGGGSGGGGGPRGGSNEAGIGGGRQYAAPPVLEDPPPPGSGGGGPY